MTLEDARQRLEAAEATLDEAPFTVFADFERDGHRLRLAITSRLRASCRRARLWKSPQLLTALVNAEYGFDPLAALSPGGRDGIFRLTRNHKPKNEMQRKLFDRFLDRPGSGAAELAAALDAPLEALLPVRLVSHHLRLLGLLKRETAGDTLVLVDMDDTK